MTTEQKVEGGERPISITDVDEVVRENVALKTALQASREEARRLREALERIASNEAFGSAGTLGRGWADNEARQRMRVAHEALASPAPDPERHVKRLIEGESE